MIKIIVIVIAMLPKLLLSLSSLKDSGFTPQSCNKVTDICRIAFLCKWISKIYVELEYIKFFTFHYEDCSSLYRILISISRGGEILIWNYWDSYLERHENYKYAVINILMTFCRNIIKFYIRKLLINTSLIVNN